MFPAIKFKQAPLNLNLKYSVKHSELYKPSVVADVRVIDLPGDCKKVCSDIQLLFNQKRLQNVLGADTASAWLASLTEKTSGIDTSKFTDDQLISFIKSRNIQTPSELMAWSEFLNMNADAVVKEYTDKLAAEQAAAQSAQQSAEQSAEQGSPKTE